MAIEYKTFNARPAIPLTTPQRRDVVNDPLNPIILPAPELPEKTPGNPVEKPDPVRDPATVPA